MFPHDVHLTHFAFAGGAFGVALLGGLHCAGMCGPIAALAAKPRHAVFYQTGRLISYASLGALAGFFGERALSWIPEDRKWIVSVALGLLALWVLLSTWNLEFPKRLQRFLWRNRPRGRETTEFLSLGVLNGLLPCHWLYGFLMVAAGTESPLKGAVLLTSLWAGALPWLLGFSSGAGLLRRLSPRSQWIARALLVTVVLGLLAHGWGAIDEHLGCKLGI